MKYPLAKKRRVPVGEPPAPVAAPAHRREPRSFVAPRGAVLPLQRKGPLPSRGSAAAFDIQRKGTNLLTATAMTSRAGANFLTSDQYDNILNEVRAYYDNGQTPDDNYGMQLHRLKMVKAEITKWVISHGSLQKPVIRGTFGYSTEDKRRLVLKDLSDSIGVEDLFVKNQGKLAADAEHQRDRNALLRYVDEGLESDDVRLRNTCEWVKTTDKTKVYPVTSTGDAYERLRVNGKSTGADGAFFPTGLAGSPGDVKSTAVSYNQLNLSDQTNVILKDGGRRTGGWQSDGHVAITNVSSRSRKDVWEVLKHEVQHDADKHYGRDSRRPYRAAGEAFDATGSLFTLTGDIVHPGLKTTPIGGIDWAAYGFQSLGSNGLPLLDNLPDQQLFQQLKITLSQAKTGMQTAKRMMLASDAEQKLERYKTEYRAYSYQEGYDGSQYRGLDDTVQDKTHGGHDFSERQLAIFKHIYAEYDHTKDGWDQDPLLSDGVTKFREAVVDYWDPDTEGFNAFNSLRIDDVYQALDEIGEKAAPTQLETRHGVDAAPVAPGKKEKSKYALDKLLFRISALSSEECDYIYNDSNVWRDKLRRHLEGEALRVVERALTSSSYRHTVKYGVKLVEDSRKARSINFW